KARSRGKVKVYVNGVYQGTVDLYSSSTQYRAIAWQRTWSSSATRTIKLVVVGTAGRPRVDIGAFATMVTDGVAPIPSTLDSLGTSGEEPLRPVPATELDQMPSAELDQVPSLEPGT